MPGDVFTLPDQPFARGAIVRLGKDGPNMDLTQVLGHDERDPGVRFRELLEANNTLVQEKRDALTTAADLAVREADQRQRAEIVETENVVLHSVRDKFAATVALLAEALRDAKEHGLIYWEPQTQRGGVSRLRMMSRIETMLDNLPETPKAMLTFIRAAERLDQCEREFEMDPGACQEHRDAFWAAFERLKEITIGPNPSNGLDQKTPHEGIG